MPKVGSIVVVLRSLGISPHYKYAKDIKWLPINDEKTTYMVRSIDKGLDAPDHLFIMLEEGIVGYAENNPAREIGLNVMFFKEVLPPEDISEQIKEYQSIPVKDRELILI